MYGRCHGAKCPKIDFTCPEAPKQKCAYAYNRVLSGVKQGVIPDPGSMVGKFESDLGWNGSGGPKDLPTRPRHQGGDVFGFMDGHAKWLPRDQESALIRKSALVWKIPLPGYQPPRRGRPYPRGFGSALR